eukprot:IDg22278t1
MWEYALMDTVAKYNETHHQVTNAAPASIWENREPDISSFLPLGQYGFVIDPKDIKTFQGPRIPRPIPSQKRRAKLPSVQFEGPQSTLARKVGRCAMKGNAKVLEVAYAVASARPARITKANIGRLEHRSATS